MSLLLTANFDGSLSSVASWPVFEIPVGLGGVEAIFSRVVRSCRTATTVCLDKRFVFLHRSVFLSLEMLAFLARAY